MSLSWEMPDGYDTHRRARRQAVRRAEAEAGDEPGAPLRCSVLIMTEPLFGRHRDRSEDIIGTPHASEGDDRGDRAPPSTIRNADKIVVPSEGEIVEQVGTDLLKQGGSTRGWFR